MSKRKNKIDELIKNSGMITHYKIVSVLKNNGWNILVSPYYYDNFSDKAREIDIIAEKLFPLSYSRKSLCVQLFIECKYIDKEVVFWFDDKNIDRAIGLVESDLYLRVNTDCTLKDLHYLTKENVAKLFSPNANKEDIVFKAVSQCLNSMVYYKENYVKPINESSSILKIIRYPVIICDKFNNLVSADLENDKYQEISDNFLLELNYTYLDSDKKPKSRFFLIDVVDINKVVNFLGIVENEKTFVANRLINEINMQSEARMNKPRNPGR
jgi:hypothetical protein